MLIHQVNLWSDKRTVVYLIALADYHDTDGTLGKSWLGNSNEIILHLCLLKCMMNQLN